MNARTQFMCLVCGEFSENGPGFCAVNLHPYEELQMNEAANGYAHFFQKGTAHLDCLEKTLTHETCDEGACRICGGHITSPAAAMKLALYVYRKRGCYAVLELHDKCFRNIKHDSFFVAR